MTEKEKTQEKHAKDTAFERAVNAAKRQLEGKAASLDPQEQEMLKTFPKEDRLAVIVFVRWCEGQAWHHGIKGKLIAKATFIEAFRIAKAIYEPKTAP